ncbi:unnamed protein product [Oikopleura dioica]|uniref:Uncharacterized protein n=1 Tax=Oikopleura dioica TaxID=34765 RepID=E4WXN0_OIKDI|nr:unnamed protein product [Oikopleura dioica]CBY35081.1 unnamed protein product [Oikopleura dioica]
MARRPPEVDSQVDAPILFGSNNREIQCDANPFHRINCPLMEYEDVQRFLNISVVAYEDPAGIVGEPCEHGYLLSTPECFK